MVQILPLHTCVQRDGNWELHLCAFQSILSLFMRYDHINCACLGPIYANVMHELPLEVLQGFRNRNFMVRRAAVRFNQVDPAKAKNGDMGLWRMEVALLESLRTPQPWAGGPCPLTWGHTFCMKPGKGTISAWMNHDSRNKSQPPRQVICEKYVLQ